jgi:hypothetical protein
MSAIEFWDSLAPHLRAIENSYLNLPSLRRILNGLSPPILVVGAGQGLLVEELRRRGLQCEGVDQSPEMIRFAKLRRGISLVKADARSLPFGDGTYGTVLYATGVIDFIGDEEVIREILREGRRIVETSGKVFVAFYRLSEALEEFVAKVGLLKGGVIFQRESLKTYLMNPVQMVGWVASRAGVGYAQALRMLLTMSLRGRLDEKLLTFRMQKIFRNKDAADALLNAAPEQQPYRNEAAIKELFARLAIPLKESEALKSCYIAQI